MGHYAKIENGIITFVTKSRDEDDNRELEVSAETGDTYRRTSYNTRGGVYYDPITNEPSEDQSKAFRYNFAAVGYTFDPDFGPDGAFIPPKPYLSWILDNDRALWNPPEPYPEDGGIWEWDEQTLSWISLVIPEQEEQNNI